ncbi:MAG: UDP-2,3-diacylglucosamine diphosphatase [Neisseriaceae bacterium]|nr:UDP-2,3-diacylglucosamine diphosphatase [Neisseriaceae bacterium]
MTQTIMIADLHLAADTPELNALFAQKLQDWQGQIDALYILGDLFDAWIGDDDDSPFIQSQLQLLHAFSQHTPLYVMRGNRDFLFGADFAQTTGATLLEEPHQVSLYGRRYVLCHGDSLCTDDLAYQQFRLQARNPQWQAMILSKPLAERRVLAAQIRQMSEGAKADNGKTAISDATEAGVQALMSQYPGADLIHGHTHRPDAHQHVVNGETLCRFVIQDWYGHEGGYLQIDADGVHAKAL